jgi:hypothetical protein
MIHIFAGILSLVQYIERFKDEPEKLRLDHCLCCGKSNPWRHGVYSREADRINPSLKLRIDSNLKNTIMRSRCIKEYKDILL